MGAEALPDYKETLRRLAINDEMFVASVLGMGRDTVEVSHLDRKTHAVARLSAALAIDGAPTSYQPNVELALAAGATVDEIVGCLIAERRRSVWPARCLRHRSWRWPSGMTSTQLSRRATVARSDTHMAAGPGPCPSVTTRSRWIARPLRIVGLSCSGETDADHRSGAQVRGASSGRARAPRRQRLTRPATSVTRKNWPVSISKTARI